MQGLAELAEHLLQQNDHIPDALLVMQGARGRVLAPVLINNAQADVEEGLQGAQGRQRHLHQDRV